MLQAQPLSLYIHIPWCVQKCPYCDFNSHALKDQIPEADYVAALIKDLDDDIARFNLTNRRLHTVFIGGGTPSLFSANAIGEILSQVKSRFLIDDASFEVTLEANPGTVEAEKFTGFAQAGVTRLSIGVQSFESDKLIKLGRIHDSEQAKRAAKFAHQAGIKSFNLDLMHGLPEQNLENALDDLKTAIALNPDHISWYQLTIEPNTAFHSKPPELPQDETLWSIQEEGVKLLEAAGYHQYEISAYAKDGKQCQHNLNYWRFGDYLGIGCGAHGKVTDPTTGKVFRTVKVKHPKGYLQADRPALDQLNEVAQDELTFEFMMNQLRLKEAFTLAHFSQATGLESDLLLDQLNQAKAQELVEHFNDSWQVTEQGHRYLNELLARFL
ncbi:radical SAM family heme chaperone HemW [Thalassotalea sp. LPB0316]|uniref:radical SAM family heme chaperone HemW n=1 Tax=Thalassotalea sp. LPB0316 TaxID=2769490 RepID=UPI0018682C8F|nr:radical SAM family heme chaperone HemW [Thalassotalea sp. LPB0316]QOL25700.1 radical SAM family heme chaperone HemW [Thalassotalea sp. LPB0316]